MTSKKLCRPRGRPRDPALQGRILASARAEFLAHGFERASVDRIAAAAKTSKVTLYQYFISKLALFHETLRNPVINALIVPEDRLQAMSPAEILEQIGRNYFKSLDPTIIAQIHALYSGREQSQDAALAFFEAGPERAIIEVSRILQRFVDAGVLVIPDVRRAAEQFLAMTRGNEITRSLLGLPARRAEEEQDNYICACVSSFLKSHAP